MAIGGQEYQEYYDKSTAALVFKKRVGVKKGSYINDVMDIGGREYQEYYDDSTAALVFKKPEGVSKVI
jgi:hypothetical protein